ncbi:MAG: hypothetical protein RL559_190 [Pseudomonadota bacterium]
MKKMIVIAALAACGVGAVQAQQSPWMVRARAVHLDMANKDQTSTTLDLSVNNKTIPEIDISYFFTKNVAAELILTVPQEQKVYAGSTQIGTFKHLPPTLTLQYHFTDLGAYKPYVGAGLNYTAINKETGAATLSGSSWGPAFQVGVDIPLDKNWSLNFDVKKVYLKTNVYVGGQDTGYLKLNPVLVGAGLGYRF